MQHYCVSSLYLFKQWVVVFIRLEEVQWRAHGRHIHCLLRSHCLIQLHSKLPILLLFFFFLLFLFLFDYDELLSDVDFLPVYVRHQLNSHVAVNGAEELLFMQVLGCHLEVLALDHLYLVRFHYISEEGRVDDVLSKQLSEPFTAVFKSSALDFSINLLDELSICQLFGVYRSLTIAPDHVIVSALVCDYSIESSFQFFFQVLVP